MERSWTSPTSLLLIAAVLVVLNLVGINWFFRADLTDQNVYSLSEASIEAVENLEDPVTITAYFPEDLPAPYSSNRRYLRDKLAEYRAYGGDRIQYRFVDPSGDQELEREARQKGIPPVQIQQVEEGQMQMQNVFMGVAIEYRDQTETIPVVRNRSRLEYQLTSALRKASTDSLARVGFLTGHGEPNPRQNMQALFRGLQQNYRVSTVTASASGLSPRPEVLLVVAPSDTIPVPQRRAIDRYVMQGGRVGWFVNAVSANLRAGSARPTSVGLDSLVSAYGIRIRPNLLMDQQSSPVSVQRQRGMFQVQQSIEYPFLPIATDFQSGHPMTSGLRRMLFYFASTVDTSAVPAGVEVEPLIRSSRNAGVQSGRFMIQPQIAKQQMATLSQGPFVIGAAYDGRFPSAYGSETSVSTRMVAVGDGDFLNGSLLGQQAVSQNVQFALNAVDWMAQDAGLLAVRSKTVEPRPLRPVGDGARPWIKYANMLGPVLLVVLLGLARWRWRANRRVVLEKQPA